MVTSDHDALLAAIAQPEDDTPRLAFADWLEENGQVDAPRSSARRSAGTHAAVEPFAVLGK